MKIKYKQSNAEFIQEVRTQCVEQAQVMSNLNDATREIIWLCYKLVELRQQTPKIEGATTAIAAAIIAQNYWQRGIGPKELLTGDNIRAYAPWKHSVKKKLHIDAVMYTNNQEGISYVL